MPKEDYDECMWETSSKCDICGCSELETSLSVVGDEYLCLNCSDGKKIKKIKGDKN